MPGILSPRAAYDRWAPTWDDDPSPIVSLESAWISPRLGEVRGALVLDAGCGTGRWMTELLRRGAHPVGLDLSPAMLARAAGKKLLEGRLVAADLARLPVGPRTFGLVLSALSLGHATDPGVAFEGLAAAVKPGGRLLVSDFHPLAIRRGWRRTFRAGGETWEAASYPYTFEDLATRAAAAGLRLREMVAPGFDEGQRAIFEGAGKLRLFDEVRGLPAILVAQWSRPCG